MVKWLEFGGFYEMENVQAFKNDHGCIKFKFIKVFGWTEKKVIFVL